MRPEQVPDAWVETAARAQYRHKGGSPDDSVDLLWESLPESHRAEWRRQARYALAAVLPDIQAQALREAADYQGPADEAAHFTPEARNLLRSLAERSAATAEGPGPGVYSKPEPKVIVVKKEENA